MTKKILVINAGSSSIKFQIFNALDFSTVASGLCERIFVDGFFKIKFGNQKFEESTPMPNHITALKYLLNKLIELKVILDLNEIAGIGHRVAQGGSFFDDACLINEKTKTQIKELIPLAPLHNKPQVDVIDAFQQALPTCPNIASFDTTFHTTMPQESYTYAINHDIATKHNIRRYGFHGNSYKYIVQKMQQILRKKKLNLIVCHLGNGASVCAIKQNQSFITSMGLTPLEGVIMGTRSGDFDPSIIFYLLRQGYTAQEIDDIVNKKSGVQGLCGSADMRDLLKKIENKEQIAELTINLYANKVAEYIVKYINLIGPKINGIVFTAGIGENSAFVVKAIINKIKIFKLKINSKKINKQYEEYKKINSFCSKYKIFCVRTNEEIIIAKDVARLLKI